MTAIVDDFAAIRGATAHVTVGDADAGEPIRLFREWVAAMRFANGDFDGNDNGENPEYQAAWGRLSEIEREIRALPPTAAGLALKVYLSYALNHSTDEEVKLDPPDGYIGDHDIAVIATAAAVLPELAPYCAAFLESEGAHDDG